MPRLGRGHTRMDTSTWVRTLKGHRQASTCAHADTDQLAGWVEAKDHPSFPINPILWASLGRRWEQWDLPLHMHLPSPTSTHPRPPAPHSPQHLTHVAPPPRDPNSPPLTYPPIHSFGNPLQRPGAAGTHRSFLQGRSYISELHKARVPHDGAQTNMLWAMARRLPGRGDICPWSQRMDRVLIQRN